MTDLRLLGAVESLIARHRRPGHVPLIAIAGAQGSGKSTLAREATVRFDAAHLSLDDAYLGKAERLDLGEAIHPLFATRGPPLTHDLDYLNASIDRLRAAGPDDRTPLRSSDKRTDDLAPAKDWPVFAGQPEAILIEGWCLGATPQPDTALARPVNALERDRDPGGVWRLRVNQALGARYRDLFRRFDALLFLKAPSFEVVLDWRCQQEAELLGMSPAALPTRDRDRLAAFLRYFERITRSMLDGGVEADLTVALDPDRRPLSGTPSAGEAS